MSLHKRDGTPCLKGEWRKERSQGAGVGFAVYSLGGDSLEVFARFSGISHGEKDGSPLVYEVGITGNPANRDHEGIHGTITRQTSEEDCLAAFNKATADLARAGATLAAAGLGDR